MFQTFPNNLNRRIDISRDLIDILLHAAMDLHCISLIFRIARQLQEMGNELIHALPLPTSLLCQAERVEG